MNNDPIGIFDSGFGGLTVLKELQRVLPYEQMIYVGDTAHLPYGTKSRETITRYSLENCSFLASQGVKLIVIACNTATSMALNTLQAHFSIPLIGVIDPVIESLVKPPKPTGEMRIGILGTQATVMSNVYQKKIHHHLPNSKLIAVPSPLLVNLVEEGFIDHPMTHLAIEEYLEPLLQAGVDTIILACTHFPLLKDLIEQAASSHVQVIDPALACAQAVKATLHKLDLLSTNRDASNPLFYVSDDPDKFQRLGSQFLKHPIADVHLYCASQRADSGMAIRSFRSATTSLPG